MQTYEQITSKQIQATPERVWQLISAVGGVDKWFSSMIHSCEIKDGKRYCTTAEGIPLIEDIIKVDHENKTFTFGIPSQEMLPATDIIETMRVLDDGSGRAIVEWSGEFKAEPEHGPTVQEALKGLWDMGLNEMEGYLAQQA